MSIDLNRARLKDKAEFPAFDVKTFQPAMVYREMHRIDDYEGVLVFINKEKAYGFLTKQMIYHHVANGEIDGEPFMVSF